MRVLVFGASSAQGYWDSQGGFADRLKRYYDQLQMRDFSIDQPAVMNLGISGDTTNELLARIGPEAEARQNEKGVSFIFQIGSNNSAEVDGKTRSTVKEYQLELEKIINKAREFSNKIIVVGLPAVDESKTTPVSWRELYFRNDNISKFENAAAEVCQKINIPFVPVFDKFRPAEMSAHDGLHPNDAGHKLIFDLVQPELDKLLAS